VPNKQQPVDTPRTTSNLAKFPLKVTTGKEDNSIYYYTIYIMYWMLTDFIRLHFITITQTPLRVFIYNYVLSRHKIVDSQSIYSGKRSNLKYIPELNRPLNILLHKQP